MITKPQVITFQHIDDKRGDLSFSDFEKDIPFLVKRAYWISEMPENQKRGGHAHRSDVQLIICIQGKAKITLEPLQGDRQVFELSSSNQGLLIPSMWWGEMTFKEKAILLGFSSADFSEEDYIRNKADFK